MSETEQRKSCHLLFQNQDILCHILSFFDDPTSYTDRGGHVEKSTNEGKKHLAAAALVSTSFFHPAKVFLWRHLPSIMPLLRLVPSFVLVNNSYTLNNVISSEEQQRIFNYSKHIQYLCLEDSPKNIKGHVIHHLLTHQDKLFPSLLSVAFDYVNPDGTANTIDCTFLALSKSLTTLSISHITDSQADDVSSILSVLRHKQAPLQEIFLSGHLPNHALMLLTCFPTLRVLDLTLHNSTLNSSTFISWADLPSLAELEVFLCSNSTFHPAEGHYRRASFPELQSLVLGGQPANTLGILQCMNKSCTLDDIRLWTDDIGKEDDLAAHATLLVSAVSSCVRISCSSLRTFEVHSETLCDIPEEWIMPLSECKNLETLRFDEIDTAIHDVTIREVCERGYWKNLRVLTLPNTVQNYSPSVTSLKVIVENCPSLQELAICVDFELLDEKAIRQERQGPRVLHPLQDLQLTISSTEDNEALPQDMEIAIGVSRFLDHCFAGLQDILIVSMGNEPDDQWHEVIVRLYSEFKEIRAEEQSCKSINLATLEHGCDCNCKMTWV